MPIADLERLGRYRDGHCLPRCECVPRNSADYRASISLFWHETEAEIFRWRLRCEICGRWGRKAVPRRFVIPPAWPGPSKTIE